MYGRETFEIVGYTAEGEVFCPDHKPAVPEGATEDEIFGTIFLDGSATDSPNHCAEWHTDKESGKRVECGALIRSDLTTDGMRYVIETIDDHISDATRSDDSVVVEWWGEWGGFIVDEARAGQLDATPFNWEWLYAMLVAYKRAALWSTIGEDGEPLDSQYNVSDIDSDGENAMWGDVLDFAAANIADLRGMDPGQAGHDFLLTRDGHGAGFWDRGLGERGDRLSAAARVYGDSGLYEVADGTLSVQ